ncbi:MAG: HepT-like ribonuclease domain-containing protein [Bacteroides sp.]
MSTWIDIIGMRHVLVHGYYTASPVFIFDTYKNDLGTLKKQIEAYISELK